MKFVIFTSNNARIEEVPSDFVTAFKQEYPHAIQDPDLSKVRGVFPHYWKLEGGQIVELSDAEKKSRDKDHEKNGVDNNVSSVAVKIKKKQRNWYVIIPWALFASSVCFQIARLIHVIG